MTGAEPPHDCSRCPRLVAFRRANAARHPGWYNGAVPSHGDLAARLMVLGLAPGLGGANRTGRPFTGDSSGALLHATLARFGFVDADGFRDCLVTNALGCVPPGNRPTPAEVAACRPYLAARIAALPGLRVVLCLGRVAHEALIRALGRRPAAHPFAHGARHALGPVTVFDSYHCSRLNTNTGRLTPEMFGTVVAGVRAALDAPAGA